MRYTPTTYNKKTPGAFCDNGIRLQHININPQSSMHTHMCKYADFFFVMSANLIAKGLGTGAWSSQMMGTSLKVARTPESKKNLYPPLSVVSGNVLEKSRIALAFVGKSHQKNRVWNQCDGFRHRTLCLVLWHRG